MSERYDGPGLEVEEIERLKAENERLKRIIKAKDGLLTCYRLGHFAKADNYLTIIEDEEKALAEEVKDE